MVLSKIKPDDLQVGLERDWNSFQNSVVRTFLVVWLRKELRNLSLQLENVQASELQGVQSQVKLLKRVLEFVQRSSWKDSLPDMLEFLKQVEK